MLYSCFDPQSGLYDVYEDDATHPVNGDLPVPQFSQNDYASNVGVPAIEAGRRLPSGAQLVGKSWNAKGLVVNCSSNGVSGFGETGTGGSCVAGGLFGFAMGALIAGALAYWVATSTFEGSF